MAELWAKSQGGVKWHIVRKEWTPAVVTMCGRSVSRSTGTVIDEAPFPRDACRKCLTVTDG